MGRRYVFWTGLFALPLLFAALVSGLILAKPVAADSYNGADLIDPTIFLNSTSMSADSIQSFLTSKGGGLASYNVYFDCASTGSVSNTAYQQAGAPCGQTVPASTVIYYAAQIYGINPQVVLATMQKEQSLITDPDPSTTQYAQAMGYACPDSGGCGASNFLYQVDMATWVLRLHYERANGNTTWWSAYSNPWACGSSHNFYTPSLYPNQNVTFKDSSGVAYATYYLANPSTSALYCYTPHAYNNYPGCTSPGDNTTVAYASYLPTVGSSGNCYTGSYNFVQSFNNWFGGSLTSAYRWQPVSQAAYTDSSMTTSQDLSNVIAGQRYFLTVRVKNIGSQTWYKGQVDLGTSQPNDRPSIVKDWTWPSTHNNRAGTLAEDSVAPGQYGTFYFWVRMPDSPGTYNEYFNLVAENITWMNDNGLYFSFQVRPQTYSWQLVNQFAWTDSTKTTLQNTFHLAKGQRYYMTVQVKNTGNMPWYSGQVNMGTWAPADRPSIVKDWTWPSTHNNRAGTLLEPVVYPGQTGDFAFWILAPSNNTIYWEHFNLVADGITWMNDNGLYFGFQSDH